MTNEDKKYVKDACSELMFNLLEGLSGFEYEIDMNLDQLNKKEKSWAKKCLVPHLCEKGDVIIPAEHRKSFDAVLDFATEQSAESEDNTYKDCIELDNNKVVI